MSDTAEDLDFWARRVLAQSRVTPLWNWMEEFVSDVEPAELEEVRRRTSGGSDLSELVDEEREERV